MGRSCACHWEGSLLVLCCCYSTASNLLHVTSGQQDTSIMTCKCLTGNSPPTPLCSCLLRTRGSPSAVETFFFHDTRLGSKRSQASFHPRSTKGGLLSWHCFHLAGQQSISATLGWGSWSFIVKDANTA